MELNRKILKICILMIALVTVLTTGLIYLLKIEEPIFLKNYCEYESPIYNQEGLQNNNTEFQLVYITDIGDQAKVESISFLEEPTLQFWASEYPQNSQSFLWNNNTDLPGVRCGRYMVKTLFVTFMGINSPDQTRDSIELNNAEISFNDGTSLSADIGRIILYRENNQEQLLEFNNGSSSSDNTSEDLYEVKDDLTLLSVETPLQKDVMKMVDLKINYMNYQQSLNKNYYANNDILIRTKFTVPNDERYTVYDIRPTITYKDQQGKIYKMRVCNLNNSVMNMDFKILDLVKYLNERGAYLWS